MKTFFLQTDTWNPWQNLAVEKYLSDQIRESEVMLYLWQNERTVVIGKNQNPLRECRTELLEKEGGFLARRTTGGGAVYHDKGNLCFTFLADPKCYDLDKQFMVIQHACQKFGIQTQRSGRNDLITEDGLKFSGNAFSQTATCCIQHGTLMLNVDKTMLERYLIPSQAKLQSKGIQSVRSRVCNLHELNPEITADAMRCALKESFAEIYGAFAEIDSAVLDNEEVHRIQDLYASWDWRYGRSPFCETSLQKRFDWGEVQVYLKLESLHIREAQIFSDALDTEMPKILEFILQGRRYDGSDLDKEHLFFDKSGQEISCTVLQKEQILQTLDWLFSCFE